VNSLAEDTISKLETQIATNIIREYRSNQKDTKDARFKYFRKKAATTSQHIEEKDVE